MPRPSPAYGSGPASGHPDTPTRVIDPAHLRELDDICGKLLAAAIAHGMADDIVQPFAQLTVLVEGYRINAGAVSA